MFGRFIILTALMTALILHIFGYIGGDLRPDIGPLLKEEIIYSQRRHQRDLSNETSVFFEEYLDSLLGIELEQERLEMSTKRIKQTKRIGIKGYLRTGQNKGLRDNDPTKNCEKLGQAIIKIMSYKQLYVYVIFTERDNGSLEKGCSENHSAAVFNVDDNWTVGLPTAINQIIKTMHGKYGPGCFEMYYYYAEFDWVYNRNSENGGIINVVITKTYPVVKLI